ncbi:MAG: rod shape-determining protein MreC [Ignavibacteriales bacterium]|nr:rod shape-determining protein MreC [Ignavibacteriales bacterium]
MLQRIYQYLFLFKEYVLLVVLVAISIILMVFNDNSQVRFIRSITIGTIGAIQQTFAFIPNIASLQNENELLRKVNVTLADEVNQLRESRLEIIRLRSMIALKETSSISLTAGKIVAKNMNLLRNTFTLDIGANDSVHVGNPIVTGEGLVGRVVAASGNYSIVQIVFNVDFRASAKVQRSRVDGILAWDGKTLVLKEIAKSQDVKEGDAIITSDYSNAFPPGIKIGIVSKITEIPNSLFKKIEVAPTVNFTMTEEVYVMDFIPSLERIVLEGQKK